MTLASLRGGDTCSMVPFVPDTPPVVLVVGLTTVPTGERNTPRFFCRKMAPFRRGSSRDAIIYMETVLCDLSFNHNDEKTFPKER